MVTFSVPLLFGRYSIKIFFTAGFIRMETSNKPDTSSLQSYSQALRAKKELLDTLQDVDDTFKVKIHITIIYSSY